jgi:uncharacterized protein (TIGR02246 family)
MTDMPGLASDWYQEERAIRAVEAAYDAAWQAGDIETLLTCLTENAVLVNPRGEVAKGHAAIRRELGEFLNGPAAGSKHTSLVSRVEFVTADVAIVDGEALVEMPGQNGQSTTSLTHRFTDVLVRKNYRWAIAHVRAYVLMTTRPGDKVGVDKAMN